MSATPAPLPDKFDEVVRLYAAGKTLKRIAETLNIPEEELREWPERYAERWDADLNLQHDDQSHETGAEFRLLLRRLMRSEKEPTQLSALRLMLQLHIANFRAARSAARD